MKTLSVVLLVVAAVLGTLAYHQHQISHRTMTTFEDNADGTINVHISGETLKTFTPAIKRNILGAVSVLALIAGLLMLQASTGTSATTVPPPSSSIKEMREWTSTKDGHLFSGSYRGQNAEYISVARSDGKIVRMSRASLAASDRLYVDGLDESVQAREAAKAAAALEAEQARVDHRKQKTLRRCGFVALPIGVSWSAYIFWICRNGDVTPSLAVSVVHLLPFALLIGSIVLINARPYLRTPRPEPTAGGDGVPPPQP